MEWKKEIELGQQLTRERKYEDAAMKYKSILEEAEHEPQIYYWAMKHFADLVGFIYKKDYFRAIDLYQRIINEYEGEDGLYEWCQVDMAKSYLNAGTDMIEAYENMTDMLTPLDKNMEEYIEKLEETREDFLTNRAEAIYKSRL